MQVLKKIVMVLGVIAFLYVAKGYRYWQNCLAVAQKGVETTAVVTDKKVFQHEVDDQSANFATISLAFNDTLGLPRTARIMVEYMTWKTTELEDSVKIRHGLPRKKIVTLVEDSALAEMAQQEFILRIGSVVVIFLLPMILGTAVRMLRS